MFGIPGVGCPVGETSIRYVHGGDAGFSRDDTPASDPKKSPARPAADLAALAVKLHNMILPRCENLLTGQSRNWPRPGIRWPMADAGGPMADGAPRSLGHAKVAVPAGRPSPRPSTRRGEGAMSSS